MTRTLLKGIAFLLLPLAVLECALRAGAIAVPPRWYPRVETEVCRAKVDFAFVGSSRVGAAIRTQAFEQAIENETKRPAHAVNLGQGYTTLAEHDLALRRIAERCAAQIAGTALFVEAPEGLPETASFADAWVQPDEPALVLPMLRGRDLVRLWSESRTPVADKVEVTARLLPSVDYLALARKRLLGVGSSVRDALADWSSRAGPVASAAGLPQTSAGTDLTSAAGILTDRNAVDRARRLARTMAENATDDPLVTDWSATVLMDLNALVRAHGGRLVVFRMPLSSVQRAPYDKPHRQANRDSFRSAARAAGIAYVDVPFAVTDEDFPDLWHLRNSRAAEFSTRLAREYQQTAP